MLHNILGYAAYKVGGGGGWEASRENDVINSNGSVLYKTRAIKRRFSAIIDRNVVIETSKSSICVRLLFILHRGIADGDFSA